MSESRDEGEIVDETRLKSIDRKLKKRRRKDKTKKIKKKKKSIVKKVAFETEERLKRKARSGRKEGRRLRKKKQERVEISSLPMLKKIIRF